MPREEDALNYLIAYLKANPGWSALIYLTQHGLLVINAVVVKPIKWLLQALVYTPVTTALGAVAPIKDAITWAANAVMAAPGAVISAVRRPIVAVVKLTFAAYREAYYWLLEQIARHYDYTENNMEDLLIGLRVHELTGRTHIIDRVQYSWRWDPVSYIQNTVIKIWVQLIEVKEFVEHATYNAFVHPVVRTWINVKHLARVTYSLTVGGLVNLTYLALYYSQRPTDIYFDGIPWLVDRVIDLCEAAWYYPYMLRSAQFYGILAPLAFGLYLGYKIQQSYWDEQYSVGELRQFFGTKSTKGYKNIVERYYHKFTQHKCYPIIINTIGYYGVFVYVYLWIERWFVNGSPMSIGRNPGSVYRNWPTRADATNIPINRYALSNVVRPQAYTFWENQRLVKDPIQSGPYQRKRV